MWNAAAVAPTSTKAPFAPWNPSFPTGFRATIRTSGTLGRSVSLGGVAALAPTSTAAPGATPFSSPPMITFLLRPKPTCTLISLPASPGQRARQSRQRRAGRPGARRSSSEVDALAPRPG